MNTNYIGYDTGKDDSVTTAFFTNADGKVIPLGKVKSFQQIHGLVTNFNHAITLTATAAATLAATMRCFLKQLHIQPKPMSRKQRLRRRELARRGQIIWLRWKNKSPDGCKPKPRD